MTTNNKLEKFIVPGRDLNIIEKQEFKQNNPQYFDEKGNFKNPEKFLNPTDDQFIINFRKDNPQYFTKGKFDTKKAVILDRGLDQFASPESAYGGFTFPQLKNLKAVTKGGDPDKSLMQFAIEVEKSKRADSQFLDAMTDSGIAFVPVWSTIHAWDELGTKGRTASIALDIADIATLGIPLRAGAIKGGKGLAQNIAGAMDTQVQTSILKGEKKLVKGLELFDPKLSGSTDAVNKAQKVFAEDLIKVEDAQDALNKINEKQFFNPQSKQKALLQLKDNLNIAMQNAKKSERALGNTYDSHVKELKNSELTGNINPTEKTDFINNTRKVITGAFDYDPKTQKATNDFLDLTADIGETVNTTKAREKTLGFVEGGNVRKNLTEQQNIKIAKNQIVNKALKISDALNAIDANRVNTVQKVADRIRKDSEILKLTIKEGGSTVEELRALKANVTDGAVELQALKTADSKILQTARNALQDALDTFPKNKANWTPEMKQVQKTLNNVKKQQSMTLQAMREIDLNPPNIRPSDGGGTALKPPPTRGGTRTRTKFDYATGEGGYRLDVRGLSIPASPLLPTDDFASPGPLIIPKPDETPTPRPGPGPDPTPGPVTEPVPDPTPGPGTRIIPKPPTRPTPTPTRPRPGPGPSTGPGPGPTPPPGPGPATGPTPTPPPGPGPAPLPPPFPSGGPGPQPQPEPFGQPAPAPTPPPPPGTPPPDADKVTTKKTPPRGDPKKTPKQQKLKTPRKPGERFIASMGVKLGSVFAKVNFNTGKVTRSRKNKWGIPNVKGKGSVVKSATILSYDNDPPTQFQLDNAVPGKTLVLGKNPRLIENKNLRRQNRRKRKPRKTRRGKGT